VGRDWAVAGPGRAPNHAFGSAGPDSAPVGRAGRRCGHVGTARTVACASAGSVGESLRFMFCDKGAVWPHAAPANRRSAVADGSRRVSTPHGIRFVHLCVCVRVRRRAGRSRSRPPCTAPVSPVGWGGGGAGGGLRRVSGGVNPPPPRRGGAGGRGGPPPPPPRPTLPRSLQCRAWCRRSRWCAPAAATCMRASWC
jgi:hypothetical protein